MNKNINLKHYDNESHGFIKISKYDLQALKIDIKNFTSYSFYNEIEACYYFEEDIDATTLLNLLKDKGYQVNLEDKFVNCHYFENSEFRSIN
jgi:hypothetical protein